MQCNVLRYWNCCLYIDWVCDILGFYLILWQEGKIHKCAIPSFFWWCNPGIYHYIKEAMENIAADWWIGSFYFARLVLIKTENGSLKNGKTCNSGSLKNGKHCYIQYIYKIKRHFSRRRQITLFCPLSDLLFKPIKTRKPLDFSRGFVISSRPDSNRRPTHYECVALPTEPRKHL